MRKEARKGRISGFSLIEVLISLTLITMIGGTVGALMVHSIKGWSKGVSKSGADNSAAVALHKMMIDISTGSSASIVSGELRVNVPPLVTDANGETYYDSNGATTTYRYYISNNNMYRQIGTANPTLFVRGISAANYYISGSLVTIVATGNNREGSQTSQQQIKDSIVLRNYGS